MSFTYRLARNDKPLPSSQMPSSNPMWYRVWIKDVTGELPPGESVEWLGEWMSTAKPGDTMYLNKDHQRCTKSKAKMIIECDV